MSKNFGFLTLFSEVFNIKSGCCTEDRMVLELCNSKSEAFQSSIVRNNIMCCLFAFIVLCFSKLFFSLDVS